MLCNEFIPDFVEEKHVPALGSKIRDHGSDNKNPVLTEQSFVCCLRFRISSWKILCKYDQKGCENLSDKSPSDRPVCFLLSPDFADHVCCQESDRVTESRARERQSSSEEIDPRCEQLCRHNVGDYQGDNEYHVDSDQV